MFILGTICCRGGSKGLKNKNIRILNGRPLLAYTIDTANQCRLLNDFVLSTDNETIIRAGAECGIKNIIMRPPDLATDEASKWLVFIHALETYEKESGKKIDYLVDMDVTVPLKRQEDIDGAIRMGLTNPDADVVITAYEAERNPYFNMVEIGDNGFAHIVKLTTTPVARRQDAPPVYSLTPAAYVIKREALYKYQHWSRANFMIYPLPRERAIDIDSQTDFEIAEFLMNR